MRSRKNNTTLTRKVDKWNTRKVWLIKRYADGHYAINQEVGGRVFYSRFQRARDAHAALVEVVTDRYPNATEEAIERIAEAASNMKLSPEAVQRILDAFDRITETIKALYEWAAQAIRTLADFFTETLGDFMLRRAPPKWRHYALHAKRARVRKKYRNRIRRAFFAALASEGGGSS